MRYLGAALYCLVLDAAIIGGCAYIVFWMHYSGWWWALAILLSGSVGVPEGVRRPFTESEGAEHG